MESVREARRRRAAVRLADRIDHLRGLCVLGMALLSPVAYVLVLTAMRFTAVSCVAPAREVSIVIRAFIGARYLKEADAHRRLGLRSRWPRA